MMRLTITLLATMIPVAAAAHPGHGVAGGWGLEHHHLDPFHLAVVGGVAVLLVVLLGPLARRGRADA